ncbi:MAG: hypothetical protein ACLQUW_05400 [Desulfobaccales bacterium]
MIRIKKANKKKNRICQGDIYKNVEFIEYILETKGTVEISKILFPLVIVLTQDCDLAQDFKFRYGKPKQKNQDKYLLSVLVAPLYNIEHVYHGEHLSEINILMETISKKGSSGNYLITNQRPRYHYLEFPPEIPIVPSIVDFKHYFSVNVEYLRKINKTNFLCQVSELYREDISQRFTSFLARIALP